MHDAVVRGMNEGKDVFTLMHEIKLPPSFVVGEGYGNLIWSIRGIYEGYAGWFDMLPATMYDVPMAAVFPDLAKLAGGAEPVTKLASQYVEAGRLVEALHLTEVAPRERSAVASRARDAAQGAGKLACEIEEQQRAVARLSHQVGEEEDVGLKPDLASVGQFSRLHRSTTSADTQLRLADVAELRAAHLIVDDLGTAIRGRMCRRCCTSSQSPGASLISRLRVNEIVFHTAGNPADPRHSRAARRARARSTRPASWWS